MCGEGEWEGVGVERKVVVDVFGHDDDDDLNRHERLAMIGMIVLASNSFLTKPGIIMVHFESCLWLTLPEGKHFILCVSITVGFNTHTHLPIYLHTHTHTSAGRNGCFAGGTCIEIERVLSWLRLPEE